MADVDVEDYLDPALAPAPYACLEPSWPCFTAVCAKLWLEACLWLDVWQLGFSPHARARP